MKRKVILLANKTFVVSLPSKWAKKYGVQKGDELELTEDGKILNIAIEKDIPDKYIEVRLIPGPSHYIRSVIGNAYKKGYGEVKVLFEDSSLMPKVQGIVDGLLGFEIIEQGKNYCLIKNVASGLDVAFENMLRRCFLMILSLSETCLNDVKACKFNNMEEIAQLDRNIEKFTDFCKRSLSRKGNEDHLATKFTYLIVWDLEKVEKEYKYIYTYLSKNDGKVKLSKETINLFEKTNNMLRLFYNAYYEHLNENIATINEMKSKLLWEDAYNILETKKNFDSVVAHHLANIIRRVYEMGGPYFGIVL